MLSTITNLILTVMITIATVKTPLMNEQQEFQNVNMNTNMYNELDVQENLNKLQNQITTAFDTVNHESSLVTIDEMNSQVALDKLQIALKEEKIETSDASQKENLLTNQRSLDVDTNDELDVTAMLDTYTEELLEESLPVYTDFRQTFYSVDSGEVKVGYGLFYNDSSIRNIDNVMHFYDDEYQEWLPVVAVNIDEVLEVGLNKRGVPKYYGTVLEITYPSGEAQKAIVLDACGACSRDNRIDLWVYEKDYNHDIKGIEYRVIREGFKNENTSGY